jgi:hypothetical protein
MTKFETVASLAKRNRIALAFLGVLAMSACSTTSQQLRSSPTQTDTVHFEVPFSVVRSNLVNKVAKCYQWGTRVSHFYTKIQDTVPGEDATFEVIQDGLATRVTISVDIKRSPNGGTDVTYFVGPPNGLAKFRPVIEKWVAGKEDCGS